MDAVRFGLQVRALRRRRRWTQSELARRVGCSRSAVARVERGGADRCTFQFLARIVTELEARISTKILWHGEELDRLLDADHARLVGEVTRRLTRLGWEVLVEVTFQIFGERGAIDVLALHGEPGASLVVEVKSVVADLQATLATLDKKVRLTPQILRERNRWDAGAPVSRLLVLPANSTTYRRAAGLEALASALPARTVAVRNWLANPAGTLNGIWFVPAVTGTGGRHRVRAPSGQAERGSDGVQS
jgi:transcriptional regulator with XRE-family HTH domain